MRRDYESIVWGITIILIGLVFLGNSLNFWDVKLFFNGWWTLFIIVPSIINLVRKRTYFSSTMFLFLGVLMLLASNSIINWDMVVNIFLPILIIALGITFVFKPKKIKPSIKDENNADYIGIFSGTEENIKGNFNGTNCTAIFGGVELDLREASIKKNIVIECVSIFGGITLKVPDNIEVKTNGVPIFGGLENKALQNIKSNKNVIYVNYVCIFGGVDITSK